VLNLGILSVVSFQGIGFFGKRSLYQSRKAPRRLVSWSITAQKAEPLMGKGIFAWFEDLPMPM
jgi:hypothetical protein